MSNPTSSFGWVMPSPSDLVTDLPADFEVFGQAVDTSLADLKGGTTNQVLAKNSNTDMDFKWVSDATGMTNPMTTTGDTIYSSSGSTPARLGIGSTDQVLKVSGGVPTWGAAPTTTFPAFRAYQSTNQSITANTFTKINFQTENFDTDNCFASSRFTPTTAGKYYFNWTLDVNSISIRNIMFYKNGANVAGMFFNSPQAHCAMQNSLFFDMNGTTDYMEIYVYIDQTTTIQSGSEYSYFEGFGVRA
jgi:hypothetical protein